MNVIIDLPVRKIMFLEMPQDQYEQLREWLSSNRLTLPIEPKKGMYININSFLIHYELPIGIVELIKVRINEISIHFDYVKLHCT